MDRAQTRNDCRLRVTERTGVRSCGPWLFVLACAVAFPGSSLAQQGDATPTITWQPDSVRMGGVPVAVERGALRVPAVRANPAAGPITLRLLRFESTATVPGGPIVYLARRATGLSIQGCRVDPRGASAQQPPADNTRTGSSARHRAGRSSNDPSPGTSRGGHGLAAAASASSAAERS
jgi:hypothetical protein